MAENVLAQAPPQDFIGQEESHASQKCDCLQDICKLHHPRGRLPTVRKRSEQITGKYSGTSTLLT